MITFTLGVEKMKSRLWPWALKGSKSLDSAPLVAWPWPLGLYIGNTFQS